MQYGQHQHQHIDDKHARYTSRTPLIARPGASIDEHDRSCCRFRCHSTSAPPSPPPLLPSVSFAPGGEGANGTPVLKTMLTQRARWFFRVHTHFTNHRRSRHQRRLTGLYVTVPMSPGLGGRREGSCAKEGKRAGNNRYMLVAVADVCIPSSVRLFTRQDSNFADDERVSRPTKLAGGAKLIGPTPYPVKHVVVRGGNPHLQLHR